jgi:hydrogenase expression/formation protein HypC
MCIGIPMRVIEDHGFSALCEGRDGRAEINMLLTGPQPAGTWVLTFLGSAREVLEEETARRIDAALDAVAAVLAGEAVDFDAAFGDLVPAASR